MRGCVNRSGGTPVTLPLDSPGCPQGVVELTVAHSGEGRWASAACGCGLDSQAQQSGPGVFFVGRILTYRINFLHIYVGIHIIYFFLSDL